VRKANTISLGRMVLAFIAVLAVAGPGFVLAGSSTPSYLTPAFAQVLGSTVVAPGGTSHYDLKVTFTDGSTALNPPGTTWTTVLGSIDSSGNYTAPSSTGRDRVTGSFTSNGVTATGNKIVFVQ
jgi:hypothetical protein